MPPSVGVPRARGRDVTASGQTRFAETGSGVLISADGKVMTAAHVVHAMDEISVEFIGSDAVTARVGAGYGWTESVLRMSDIHHRLQLDAAASVRPLPWLATGLRVLGRYDAHKMTGGASDSGIITETHLGTRAVFPVGDSLHAGTQLDLWLPAGDDVGNAFSALSGSLQLIAAYTGHPSLTVGLSAGLLMDRSKHTGGDPMRYSASDRLALGVSDALWGTRQGVALSYRFGAVEAVAEWAYRMYFARPAKSPMWIRLGVRGRPTEALQLELLLGVSPSKRPSLADNSPLAVVEPRLSAELSVVYAWSLEPPPPTAAPEPAPPPRPEPPKPARLQGQVLAKSGAALPLATVTLVSGEDRRQTQLDEQGHFTFTDLPAGDYSVEVNAEGFVASQKPVSLSAGAQEELRFELEAELPIGQIRGTVRRFDGKPVAATVAIAQLKIKQPCEADGTFELNVPPGQYTVVVTAKGFAPQTRKAKVEHRGVAILIVELEPGR